MVQNHQFLSAVLVRLLKNFLKIVQRSREIPQQRNCFADNLFVSVCRSPVTHCHHSHTGDGPSQFLQRVGQYGNRYRGSSSCRFLEIFQNARYIHLNILQRLGQRNDQTFGIFISPRLSRIFPWQFLDRCYQLFRPLGELFHRSSLSHWLVVGEPCRLRQNLRRAFRQSSLGDSFLRGVRSLSRNRLLSSGTRLLSLDRSNHFFQFLPVERLLDGDWYLVFNFLHHVHYRLKRLFLRVVSQNVHDGLQKMFHRSGQSFQRCQVRRLVIHGYSVPQSRQRFAKIGQSLDQVLVARWLRVRRFDGNFVHVPLQFVDGRAEGRLLLVFRALLGRS